MSNWQPYNRGRSIGIKGSEGGTIVRDEEHLLGARMTIKQGKDYVSISCNISGMIDHTRFFKGMKAAERELAKVMDSISFAKAADIKVWEAISEFVARFP